MAIVARQPWQQTRPQERRLSGARCAEDDEQPGRRRLPQTPQPVECIDDSSLATEENAGVIGVKWQEPSIGGAVRIVRGRPSKELGVEAGLNQPDA